MNPDPGPEPARIFLVGVSDAVSRALARYIDGDPRVVLIGAVPSLALAGVLLPATRPDLALLDWAVFADSPGDMVQALRLERPGLRIVCVASEAGPYRAAAARAGADAAIGMDNFDADFESALRGFFPDRFRGRQEGAES